jgi:hypothetical protein
MPRGEQEDDMVADVGRVKVSERDIRLIAYTQGEGSDLEADFGIAIGWFRVSGDVRRASNRRLAEQINRSVKEYGYPGGLRREI